MIRKVLIEKGKFFEIIIWDFCCGKTYFYHVKIRYFILCVLLLAYGTLLGHELVYGHHIDAAETCHHHHSGCCQHNHDNNSGHLPCGFDMNPHFASSQDVDIAVKENLPSLFLLQFCPENDLLVIAEIGDDEPPDLPGPGLYSDPVCRIPAMRGPPIA